jgi:FkbM family methyltransferase
MKENLRLFETIGRKVRPVELALLVKWFLRIKRFKYALSDGSAFYIDPISDFGLKLMKHNSYEYEMTNHICGILKQGDSFIDLGANEGFFSIVASRIVGNSGTVFSIEPQQRLWQVIIKNIEINGLTNVQLIPFGISSTPGEAAMNLYPTLNSGASSLAGSFNFKVSLKKIRKAAYTSSTIRLKTLDEVIPSYIKNIKLIKIDIEGFEYEALTGAKRLLETGVLENLLIELHPEALESMGKSKSSIDSLMAGYNYKGEEVAVNLMLYKKVSL